MPSRASSVGSVGDGRARMSDDADHCRSQSGSARASATAQASSCPNLSSAEVSKDDHSAAIDLGAVSAAELSGHDSVRRSSLRCAGRRRCRSTTGDVLSDVLGDDAVAICGVNVAAWIEADSPSNPWLAGFIACSCHSNNTASEAAASVFNPATLTYVFLPTSLVMNTREVFPLSVRPRV